MKVHEFLDKPERWTKNAYARNAFNYEVDVDDPSANSWNISGAINYIYFLTVSSEEKTDDYKKNLAAKMRQIIDIIGTTQVWEWEAAPERTFEEVHSILKQVDI